MSHTVSVVHWTKAADADLTVALEHAGGPRAAEAKRLAQSVLDADRLLMAFPAAGRAGRQVGTRELFLKDLPFFVVYRVVDPALEVLRLMHTSRQWPPKAPARKAR